MPLGVIEKDFEHRLNDGTEVTISVKGKFFPEEEHTAEEIHEFKMHIESDDGEVKPEDLSVEEYLELESLAERILCDDDC